MNDVRVTDTQGRDIHIGPHDICRYDPDNPPIHYDTDDVDVRVDTVIPHGSIAVIFAHALKGSALYVVTYDRDDRVRRVA